MIPIAKRVGVIYLGYNGPEYFMSRLFLAHDLQGLCGSCEALSSLSSLHQEDAVTSTPLFQVVSVGPFMKWGIDYVTCNPASAGGHKYIIVTVDYFTKWAEAMPTFKVDRETVAFFVFNQIIARFGIPKVIFTDHGSHF